MKLGIAEVLKMVSEAKTNDKKIELLRKHDCVPIRVVLKCALDPEIEWLLPKGKVPYTPCELPDLEGVLYSDIRKLLIFTRSGEYDNLARNRREMLFIEFMEGLAPLDAMLIEQVKDKTLPWDISPQIISEAYPGLLPAGLVTEAKVQKVKKSVSPKVLEGLAKAREVRKQKLAQARNS